MAVARRMSPSMTNTLRPLMANAKARFMVMNDLPEPANIEVTRYTFLCLGVSDMNSMLERNMRNASLMAFWLFCCTNRGAGIRLLLLFFLKWMPFNFTRFLPLSIKGTSPTTGIWVRLSMSSLPRTVVLRLSLTKMMTAGKSKPMSMAASSTLFLLG